jgi:hypothetical protein
MLSLSRNLGLITGASVMGAVFALASGTVDITTSGPETVAAGMRITFAAAAMLMVFALAIVVSSRAARSEPLASCLAGRAAQPANAEPHRVEKHQEPGYLSESA